MWCHQFSVVLDRSTLHHTWMQKMLLKESVKTIFAIYTYFVVIIVVYVTREHVIIEWTLQCVV
jgi:hypothetical protein